MFNKVFALAFVLLFVGSQALLLPPTSELIRALITQTQQHNTLSHLQNNNTNAKLFVQGFLAGIETADLFVEIQACITDDVDVEKDVKQAVALIQTKDPENVKEGIELLGKAAKIIPTAAQSCQAADADVQRLVTLIKSFNSPTSFFYYVGKSLLINHVDVINEVNGIVDAYNTQNITGTGYWVGKAMATIFLADGRTLRQGFVDFLNENSGWRAELPEKFKGMTIGEIKSRFLGAKFPTEEEKQSIPTFNYEGLINDIPTYFNSSEQWPGCIHPIRDQGHCGSCWAFAASESLSDRFCIASNSSVNVVLSPQYLLSCNNILNHGCKGGTPIFSWKFIENSGLLTDGCLPYKSSNGTNGEKCKDIQQCDDGSQLKNYFAAKGSTVSLNNPASIQANLIQYGPVEAAFVVYEDFLQYKSGIYVHTSGDQLGGHAVKITGWGNENGTDYWIVANSWNTTWGENGFFRIAFGQCGIDAGALAGQADLTRTSQSHRFRFW